MDQRELLKNLASDLQTAETRMFTQVESTFKWLMATLWASNGGALVVTLGSEDLLTRLSPLPIVCFTVGAVLSLIMGLINLLYASKALQPISELKNIFVIGATVGEFDSDAVTPLTDQINRSTIFKWPLWVAGIGSLSLFVFGAILIGMTLW